MTNPPLTQEPEELRQRRKRRTLPLQVTIAWSRHQPHRAGECFLVGAPHDPEILLGRQEDGEPDCAAPVRRRPGRDEPRPKLSDPSLSRQQLRVKRVGADQIELCLLGAGPVHVNGTPLEEQTPMTVELGARINVRERLLLYVERAEPLADPEGPLHPFGEPDAYGVVGESAAAWRTRYALHRAAAQQGHILVHGETGTGKELAARTIHLLDHPAQRRADQLHWVPVNVAALPEGLVEAELFGNAEHYPDGKSKMRQGFVGRADRSTLFLDEFAELSKELQTRFLRLLETGEYTRLGEDALRRSTARVVAATNRPLDSLREDIRGRFEHEIELVPLRRRPGDIALLVRFLLRQMAETKADLRETLLDGDEPNVSVALIESLLQRRLTRNTRELKKVLREAISNGVPGRPLDVPWPRDDAPDEPGAEDPEAAPEGSGPWVRSVDVTREQVLEALEHCDWNKTCTFQRLGMKNRDALRHAMKRLGIPARRPPEDEA